MQCRRHTLMGARRRMPRGVVIRCVRACLNASVILELLIDLSCAPHRRPPVVCRRASATEVVHTVQPPPLQAFSCHQCRSMKGEGDRGLGEIGESEC
eukprot:scaffold8828_cov129-Isochrysis_galbana.AAC.5